MLQSVIASGVYSGYLDSGMVQVHMRVTEEEYHHLRGMDTMEICNDFFHDAIRNLMIDNYSVKY